MNIQCCAIDPYNDIAADKLSSKFRNGHRAKRITSNAMSNCNKKVLIQVTLQQLLSGR